MTVLGIYETTRDDRAAYYLQQAFQDSLVQDQFDYSISKIPKNYLDVSSIDEYWLWVNG